MTVPEILHMIETRITQTIEIEKKQTTYHETIQTTDQTITIIKIDHLTIPGIEILIIQIDIDTILSHHTEIIQNIQIHNKTVEAVLRNIKDKFVTYNQLNNFNQTIPVLTTQKNQLELQLEHIHFESADDESVRENTLTINMLHTENEYETPIESIYYQNNESVLILKNQIIHKI